MSRYIYKLLISIFAIVLLFALLLHIRSRDNSVYYYFPQISLYGKVTIANKWIYIGVSKDCNKLAYKRIPDKDIDYISVPTNNSFFYKTYLNKESRDTLFTQGCFRSNTFPIISVKDYACPIKGVFWHDHFTNGDGLMPLEQYESFYFDFDEKFNLMIKTENGLKVTELKRKRL